MYANRLIFKTSDSDEVYYLNDTVFVKFNSMRNTLSNSVLNGALRNDLRFVFNHHLSQEAIDYLESHDLLNYLISHCKNLDLDYSKSSGLVTLAKMKNLSIVTKKYRALEVTALTTAGVRVNACCAGDKASYYEEDGVFHPGTINSIILINSRLSDSTLAEAFMTACEAKSVALNDLRIPSQFSNRFATGTGTDGLIIASNLDSVNLITNAGKHSKLGELIAKSVIESVHEAIKKQVWISGRSQSNVLVRLNRYKLDINEFYEGLSEDKHEFISMLKIDSQKSENVAIASSVLNLFDEVSLGLIEKEAAYNLAVSISDSCESYPVKKLLDFWISSFFK